MKKKLKNTPDARLMRQAVAFDRLAAKAFRAGNMASFRFYSSQSSRLKDRAYRIRERRAAGLKV